MQTLIIDHYDSFTYNLYQLIAQINGIEPIVMAHDAPELYCLDDNLYDNIILSPGPGHPDNEQDFATGKSIISCIDKPILGVCLGHQGIFSTLGGSVDRAATPVHGCVSKIFHNQDTLFANMPSPFQAMRYHSLICTGPIPAELTITAWTEDHCIMGLAHRFKPIWGIQYHPESIATEYGHQLLVNFLNLTANYYQQHHQTPPSQQKLIHNDSLPKPTPSEPANHYEHNFQVLSQKYPFKGDPAGIFQQLLADQSCAVWLDSSLIVPGFSRFSYMGSIQGPMAYHLRYDAETRTITRFDGHQSTQLNMSIFTYLQQALDSIKISPTSDLPFEFHGGFIGYFGYELNQETASIPITKPRAHPDAQWLFLDRIIVIDHQTQYCYGLALSTEQHLVDNQAWLNSLGNHLQTVPVCKPSDLQPAPLQGKWVQAPDAYQSKIRDCLAHIDAGESYELCLTNKLQFSCHIDSLKFYINLRHHHPAPHAAFLKFDDLTIACSSMERFLKVNQQRQIEAKPIKGTAPRGQNLRTDRIFARELQQAIKFQSEHWMIVDLLRNDLGKICQIGSVSVPDLLQVETYATLHQLVSRITGQLRADVKLMDCVQHTFPGGSMTGAPKIRSMHLINSMETQARGIYSGSLGYISVNGCMDLNIVIRTAEMFSNHLSIGAGGAIIALSNPKEEFAEMLLKTQALRTALSVTLQEQNS